MTVKADLVSGILPVREDGRVVLLQRPAGTWEPPAGRLIPGENFEDGAVRELYEETGILAAPQRILATWVGERPGGEKLASVTYVARIRNHEVRITGEHLDHRWVTIEEWMELPSWWSRENIRGVAGIISSLPTEPLPEPSPPSSSSNDVVRANLGAGLVLADTRDSEPRALLLRRRKPPAGLWENPGGMLEAGEDFIACAHRETLEETGIKAEPGVPWWARVEPWRSPDDPELYAGAGFLARHPGGEVRIEDSEHDSYLWATEEEWRKLPTWYTKAESDDLWLAIRRMSH